LCTLYPSRRLWYAAGVVEGENPVFDAGLENLVRLAFFLFSLTNFVAMANQWPLDAPESSGQGQIIRQGTSGVSGKVSVR